MQKRNAAERSDRPAESSLCVTVRPAGQLHEFEACLKSNRAVISPAEIRTGNEQKRGSGKLPLKCPTLEGIAALPRPAEHHSRPASTIEIADPYRRPSKGSGNFSRPSQSRRQLHQNSDTSLWGSAGAKQADCFASSCLCNFDWPGFSHSPPAALSTKASFNRVMTFVCRECGRSTAVFSTSQRSSALTASLTGVCSGPIVASALTVPRHRERLSYNSPALACERDLILHSQTCLVSPIPIG